MARELVEHEVVIASGLAKGIDAAAHQATLTAGGRTFAVMGTGIAAAIYPAENRPLAGAILAAGGALLSQFWPTSPPAKYTFPRRNVVTSGTTWAASSSRPPAPPARRCRPAWLLSTASSSS
ncbi:DNA-processing protein DprA [Streptomyces scabiei]